VSQEPQGEISCSLSCSQFAEELCGLE